MNAITLDQLTDDQGVARRDFTGMQIRAESTDSGSRTVTGIGVPYDQEYENPWFRERFERGAIEDDSNALACYMHGEPIGRLTASRDTDEGREVTLTLSSTTRAVEAHTLAQDDVIRSLSIGFKPIQWREEHSEDDDRPLIVHERVEVREYSLVPFPAYQGARIASVRSDSTPPAPQEDSPMTATTLPENVVTRDDLDAATEALTATITDVERRMATTATGPAPDELEARAALFADLGEWVQAIADEHSSRHEDAMLLYRDVTTSDVPSKLVNKPGFIGDLTKKVVERRRWVNRFKTRALPSKGMTVDYIKTLVTATIKQQAAQLDPLEKGSSFTVTPANAPVKTYGGAETVSRQVIDRSEAWALTALFEAFAIAYGRETEAATKAYVIAEIQKILTADVAGTTVPVPTEFGAFDWIDAVVDSAELFDDLGYDLTELAVSKNVFKRLASEAGTDGRPLLTVSGQGVNVVGQMNLPKVSGELLRVPVTLLSGAADNTALFYDPIAIETLESPGAPFMLQQDQVLNLSRDFAAYGYMAHITPHPKALLPVKFTTAPAAG